MTDEEDMARYRHLLEVASFSIDGATGARDVPGLAYLLGCAMGVLSELAYDELGFAQGKSSDTAFDQHFLRGFDQGIVTAKAVVEMLLDPMILDLADADAEPV